MRIWFVTGASRGFGAQIIAEVLAAGDAVVATARDPKGITAKHGEHPRLLATRLDVTQEAQVREAVEAAIQRFGRIDVLVNNAGYGLLGAVEEASAKEIERLFATNVFGLLTVTRAVLPHMRRQRSGHVINMSSTSGYSAMPSFGLYSATKSAVEGLTEALAAEVAPLGIRATLVEPGFFRTDFLDASSLSVTEPIADYAATSGVMRAVISQPNNIPSGSTTRLAKAMLALANSAQPPLRLPLGSDAIARIEDKHRHVTAELAAWRELARSTDESGTAS